MIMMNLNNNTFASWQTNKMILINSLIVLVVALIYAYYVHSNMLSSSNKTTTMTTKDPQIELLKQELYSNPIDPNSFSRPDKVRIKQIDLLKLRANFNEKILSGSVSMTATVVDSNATELILDTFELKIKDVYKIVENNVQKQEIKIPYQLHSSVPEFGSKLSIGLNDIEKNNHGEFKIKIIYQTNPDSRALLWLSPEQTDGQKHPFLYSQCEAINARALLPCQDTPSVKAPYTAEIEAPTPLTALMSAKIVRSPEPIPQEKGYQRHFFYQKVPIPSYLIAIAIGQLTSMSIGNISRVWSEPGVIKKAEWEFEQIDQLITSAQHFAGPYVWEVYDLLVLPPSFPYGGMENPCLTFVTPTLLAGDRSLVNVVAHEIAHSWTGNLVTNANFGHFWLNEGFTTFLERKIVGHIEKDGEKYRQFAALEGLHSLSDTVKRFGPNHPYTKLLVDVRGVNPDDAFSDVPYEKGHTLLFYLEQILGGPKVFEPFLKAYIDHFKYQSIITDDFQKFLFDYFSKNETKTQTLKSVKWDSWLHQPGMPPIIPDYDKSLLQASINLANKWLQANAEDINEHTFPIAEFERLISSQQKLFLFQLRDSKSKLATNKLQLLSNLYRMSAVKNCEVRFAWIVLGLVSKFDGVVDEAVHFVGVYGRMKYVIPIYSSLYQWEKTRELAIKTFQSNRHRMMRMASDAIAKELHVKSN